jgi:hypothetical protein
MLDHSPECRALSRNGSRREAPCAHSDHAAAQCSIGFRPVLGFATGNTLEMMGVVARVATTKTTASMYSDQG